MKCKLDGGDANLFSIGVRRLKELLAALDDDDMILSIDSQGFPIYRSGDYIGFLDLSDDRKEIIFTRERR